MNLIAAPLSVQNAFIKQIGYLSKDLRHPSLRAKKYEGGPPYSTGRIRRG